MKEYLRGNVKSLLLLSILVYSSSAVFCYDAYDSIRTFADVFLIGLPD